MKAFTYKDYIKCIHTLRLNAVLQLAEEGTEYNMQQKKMKNRHDKLAKSILKDEKEMAQFINGFLEPNEKIESNNLIKYTNSYINKKFKVKEADLVYKLKNKEIFFLVEHQSSIDNSMPYRILNYCIDIMQEWSRTRKIKRETKYPIIVPIIIYTGNEKWKIPKNFKEKQIGDYVFENYKIDLEYNLVEINKLSKKFLLQKRSLFGYGMIIEKSKNKQELRENLGMIVEHIKNKDQLDEIKNIILYLLNDSLEEGAREELIEKIEIKMRKGEDVMSSLYERLVNENRQMIRKGKRQGREEAKLEIAKKLIKKNANEKMILEITEVTQKDLEKLKKQVLE